MIFCNLCCTLNYKKSSNAGVYEVGKKIGVNSYQLLEKLEGLAN